MATKTATIIARIEEEEGVIIEDSIQVEYDNDDDFTWTDIDFEYESQSSGGPILRPKKPR